MTVVEGLTNQSLVAAFASLRLGGTEAGRRVAHGVYGRGRSAGDTHLQAQAMLVLAHAYVFESRFRLACRCCTRARELFVRHGDAGGLAEASGVLAYVAATLGLQDHARQCAAEGLSLRDGAAGPLAQAFGLNYAGVAAFWARDFATASGLLDAAAWYATNQSPGGAAAFHPLVNAAACEALRILLAEPEADLGRMERIVGRARAMEQRGRIATLRLGSRDIGLLLLAFEECFLACRRGDLEEAEVCYRVCSQQSARLPATSWLYAVNWWARAERAQAHGRLAEARSCAAAMAKSAELGQHVPLRTVGLALKYALQDR